MEPTAKTRNDDRTGKIAGGMPLRGSNQLGMRAYNERLVLSLVRRHGQLAKSEIARLTGLSAQTVSVIMRALEAEDLLVRGLPQRGKVGQPSVPLSLNPDGVLSLGLKIGRRSADLILMDFTGAVREAIHEPYAFAVPDQIFQMATEGVARLTDQLSASQRERIGGLGIAMPFELWNWAPEVGAPGHAMDGWRNFDIKQRLEEHLPFPVYVRNDATAACGAELVFGRGAEFIDFVYFFVGFFGGGGIVLNGSLYTGRTGNAGALGPMPVPGSNGRSRRLIDTASIAILERMIRAEGEDPSVLWHSPGDWSDIGHSDLLDDWIALAAEGLASATVSACSVVDFGTVIVDGAFPDHVREALVSRLESDLHKLDWQGISMPQVVEGSIGTGARAIGGASVPIFEHYLLDQNALLLDQAD